MTATHTPTPWFTDARMGMGFYICREHQNGHIAHGVATYQGIADAEHIVACVNAHDKLVADLERCKAALDHTARMLAAALARVASSRQEGFTALANARALLDELTS